MKVFVKNGNVEKAIRVFKRKVTDSGKLFDYKEKNADPLIQTVSVKRHGEPVWDIKWMTPDESGRGRFCSISTDGKLRCWTQVKYANDISELKILLGQK